MIAVMGASGNTGGRISQQLLHEGENIRVLGRSAKLAGLESKGAEVLTGYTLLPPDPQSPDLRMKWDQEGEAIVTAIRASGVRHVVFLSSAGADRRRGAPPEPGHDRPMAPIAFLSRQSPYHTSCIRPQSGRP
jgi:uncharacterized protein YbjT (DUF2867 family)